MLLYFSKGSVIEYWLFHLYSAVKNTAFFSIFPLVESKAKAFCRLILGTSRKKHQPFSMTQPFQKGSKIFLAVKRPCGQYGKRGYIKRCNPCNLWSQHADLNRGPTDYEKTGFLKKIVECIVPPVCNIID